MRYFPELHLARWFKEKRRESVSVYGIERAGVKQVTAAYSRLAERLGPLDAVILIDSGTDSLMRGDKPGRLDAVARRCLYLDAIRDTESYFDLNLRIAQFRAANQAAQRAWKSLPM